MARAKLTARKHAIVMPTRRTRFMLSKRVPPHLVEALRDMEEEPMEVPMEEPMDEEAGEEPMFEEPLEIEDSDEEPMEEDEQEEQQGVKMELVTSMMEMILITLTLMEMMTVMEMMVETKEMVEGR